MTRDEIQKMSTPDLVTYLGQLNRVIEDAIQDMDPQARVMIQDVTFCNAILDCRRLMENNSFCEPAPSLDRFDEMMQSYSGCEDAVNVIDEYVTEFVCKSCDAIMTDRRMRWWTPKRFASLVNYLSHYASRLYPGLRERVRRAVVYSHQESS